MIEKIYTGFYAAGPETLTDKLNEVIEKTNELENLYWDNWKFSEFKELAEEKETPKPNTSAELRELREANEIYKQQIIAEYKKRLIEKMYKAYPTSRTGKLVEIVRETD